MANHNFLFKIRRYCFAVYLLLTKTSFNSVNLYSGQDVAIVGPAIDLEDIELIDFINSHKIVVHVNKTALMLPLAANCPHLRVDHIYRSYNNFTITSDESKLLDSICSFSIICGTFFSVFKKILFYFANGGTNHVYINNFYTYNKLLLLLGKKRPSHGMCAIWSVINGGAISLFVSGFTFYQSESSSSLLYNKEYRSNAKALSDLLQMFEKKHDVNTEFEIFKNLILHSKCQISCDNRLSILIDR